MIHPTQFRVRPGQRPGARLPLKTANRNVEAIQFSNSVTSYHLQSHTIDIKLTLTKMALPTNNSTVLLLFVGAVTLIAIAARRLLGHDPREPPLAPQSIPMIGHMVGLSRSKFNYYVDLRYVTGPS